RFYLGIDGCGPPINSRPRSGQKTDRTAIGVGQQRSQHMGGFYVLIVVFYSETLRIGKRLLELCGEFIESHNRFTEIRMSLCSNSEYVRLITQISRGFP